MEWVSLLEANRTDPIFPHRISPPPPPPPVPPPPPSHDGLDSRISPSVLLIIVILAVVFFVSGLLHLLVRYLLRPARRNPEDPDNVTALQGQLQQLFHLHDAGVDQSFIDALPVFPYRAITGVKDPFDCAVCLCEFEAEDKLRLLPKCSHAFHLECIDTWLLSHSTCPLCRSSLLQGFPTSCSPIVLVLESGGESSREIAVPESNPQSGPHVEEDPGQPTSDHPQKAGDPGAKEVEPAQPEAPGRPERVVPVKLGKFRNVDGGAAGAGEGSCSGSGNGNLDERRCFSMGSFEYVMDQSSLLQVAIKQPVGKLTTKKPGHRPAMSECGCNSRREGHRVFSSARISSNSQRRESFSISKIWLRSKSEKPAAAGGEAPRRVLSLRLPLGSEEGKLKCGSSRRTMASDLDGPWWVDKSGSEVGVDVEAGGGGGGGNGRVASRADETPSFARSTLMWLVGGRNPKVVNHS
ncbi:hypothetical protein Taro_041325 [Colocasia esculenta]|uniref:RING-type E3 ubiquitin transferase n=1 Tax=Colocasia esculenta TaxID=4460 RepID=A0A843WWY7_COLES|nr:hypothetical protein [Colocasia esculenta]